MSLLNVTFACNRYDRTTPLADGTVKPRGIDLNVLLLGGVEQVFWRMLMHQEFDASEMSLSSYLMMRDRGQDDLIAIPVFLSRVFRHSCIFVREDSKLEDPKQLIGATVGVPEYQMTAAVWAKAILLDEYGVHPHNLIWRNGGLDQPGRIEKLKLDLPADIRISYIPAEETLNQQLLDGKIDALVTARSAELIPRRHEPCPPPYPQSSRGRGGIYLRTKIFPPMHTVVIKRKLYEANRWMAMSLFEAFQETLTLCDPLKMFDGHLRYSLPFLPAWIEELQTKFGGIEMWKYGFEPNRKTLETLVRNQKEQGLVKNDLRLEDMFAPENTRFVSKLIRGQATVKQGNCITPEKGRRYVYATEDNRGFAALMTVTCTPPDDAAMAASDDAGKPLRQLTVKLDYTPIWGFMLPIIVAESKGYYRDVGLQVDINEGSDSTSTIGAVDGGHADIGFADAGAGSSRDQQGR